MVIFFYVGLINLILWWFGVIQKKKQAVLHIRQVRYWYFPAIIVRNIPASGPCMLIFAICSLLNLSKFFIKWADLLRRLLLLDSYWTIYCSSTMSSEMLEARFILPSLSEIWVSCDLSALPTCKMLLSMTGASTWWPLIWELSLVRGWPKHIMPNITARNMYPLPPWLPSSFFNRNTLSRSSCSSEPWWVFSLLSIIWPLLMRLLLQEVSLSVTLISLFGYESLLIISYESSREAPLVDKL